MSQKNSAVVGLCTLASAGLFLVLIFISRVKPIEYGVENCPSRMTAAGRAFNLRRVPSCGINRLSGLKRDRQLVTVLDKFFEIVERRNSHGPVDIPSLIIINIIYVMFMGLSSWL